MAELSAPAVCACPRVMPNATLMQSATARQPALWRIEGGFVQPTRDIVYGSYSTAFSFRAVSGDVEPTALRWTMPQRPLPRLQPNSGLPEFGRFIDWPKSEIIRIRLEGQGGGAQYDRAFPPPHPPQQAGEG